MKWKQNRKREEIEGQRWVEQLKGWKNRRQKRITNLKQVNDIKQNNMKKS